MNSQPGSIRKVSKFDDLWQIVKVVDLYKNLNYMKIIPLLTIILISSCENNKETIVNKQQDIKKEMEQVKAFYYRKIDSLESVNEADTNSAKLNEELSLAEGKKTIELLKLQKEYDSLEVELKK